jgi:hypothetical protein
MHAMGSEPIIRNLSELSFPKSFFHPPHPHLLPVIKLGHKGLHIEKRRAVQHVHFRKIEDVSLSFLKPNNGKTDRVRPPWGSDGKKASNMLLHVRAANQVVSFKPVEDIDQNEMRETLGVLKSRFKFLEDLRPPFGFRVKNTLNRDTFLGFVGRMENPDGDKRIALFHDASRMLETEF